LLLPPPALLPASEERCCGAALEARSRARPRSALSFAQCGYPGSWRPLRSQFLWLAAPGKRCTICRGGRTSRSGGLSRLRGFSCWLMVPRTRGPGGPSRLADASVRHGECGSRHRANEQREWKEITIRLHFPRGARRITITISVDAATNLPHARGLFTLTAIFRAPGKNERRQYVVASHSASGAYDGQASG